MSPGATITPQARLQTCIERFDPGLQRLIRSVRSAMRRRLAAANELLYDYTSSLVIAYSPTERPTESIVSLAARADGLRLYFTHGARLADPNRLLQGTGRQTRFIRVAAARLLADPDVEALVASAIDTARVPLPPTGRGRLVDRSATSTGRPRGSRGK